MDQAGQVREKIDIVSLISEYIPLKKMGANFKANCPFHQENTPSFVVSPERQIWHCFGCGKGGDCFSFVMEYENMEFPEALRTLAKKAGVTISESTYQKGVYSQKEKIYKLNSQAAKFYNFLLTQHPIGKTALEYLVKKRGLNEALIDTYSLGVSPNDNSLSKYLMGKKGHKKEDLVEAGLSIVKNGRILDFFRGRIMFPLSDHRGNIVGFSGRSMDESNSSKYINTKETAVYHKGSLFFGLESAKEEIKKEGAIVVEGEFDALSSFKEGIKNVVAIKGTALTENQANLLSRFTKKITLCLDQDSAGFEATKRSLAPLEKAGMTINIMVLEEKDPDEQLKKNPGIFKKALKESVGAYDFIISKTLLTNDIKTAEGIKNVTQDLLPYIAQIQNEIVKEHYIKKLAQELDTSYQSLTKEIGKIEGSKKDSSAGLVPSSPVAKRYRREILEQYILSLIIQNENVKDLLDEEEKFFSSYEFDNLAYNKISDNLKTYFEKKKSFNSSEFANFLPEEL
ncbi:MAG TPA: DNA primase, partial [Patescibacteria group bacterium]|nr:DNA primase [Patescibacteria group bacterium]